MNINLIHGEFTSQEALDLVTNMIHIKIKYHENKILSGSSEEDIKWRESKIKALQKELFEFRNGIARTKDTLKLEAHVQVSE